MHSFPNFTFKCRRYINQSYDIHIENKTLNTTLRITNAKKFLFHYDLIKDVTFNDQNAAIDNTMGFIRLEYRHFFFALISIE